VTAVQAGATVCLYTVRIVYLLESPQSPPPEALKLAHRAAVCSLVCFTRTTSSLRHLIYYGLLQHVILICYVSPRCHDSAKRLNCTKQGTVNCVRPFRFRWGTFSVRNPPTGPFERANQQSCAPEPEMNTTANITGLRT
jgi:hypothetical protein